MCWSFETVSIQLSIDVHDYVDTKSTLDDELQLVYCLTPTTPLSEYSNLVQLRNLH